jgi:Glycoside-hydrolase family GH114
MRLVLYFDFAVSEQCFQYRECGVLDRFIAAGKPVFGAEYRVPLSRFCERSIAHGFSTIKKRFSLRAFRRTCPPTSGSPAGDP